MSKLLASAVIAVIVPDRGDEAPAAPLPAVAQQTNRGQARGRGRRPDASPGAPPCCRWLRRS
jgi:hypothetical protein